MSQLERAPQVLVSGSAVGFYGNRGDERLTENAEAGQGFLTDVCVEWENEALKAETEKNLASYRDKMEKEVFQRTFDLMLLKKLREQSKVPRLSLFYL